jgi:hypothetical protein
MENKTEINETAPAASITKRPKLRLQIELRAYQLWLEDGGRYDNRLIHLLRAEREVMNGYPQP